MTAAMIKRFLITLTVGMAPGAIWAQDVYETCENLPFSLVADVPLEIDADSAQWFLNDDPVGPLEIEPLASEWYDTSLGVDESGLYKYVAWFTDAEGFTQDSLLGSWQVTVWATLGFNSVADTFALCANGDTQLELGATTGGSGNFDWTWTAFGANDTLVVDLPPSLSQTWGPEADSAQWAVSITDLEGCGSITSINWTFETQDSLYISLSVIDGNGVDGLWCHGESIALSATPGYSEYIWTWVDDLGSMEVGTTVPTWTTPELTSATTVYVRATSDSGCSTATDTLHLDILDPIEAPIIAPLGAICFGDDAEIALWQEATPSELNWFYTWVDEQGAVLGTGSSIQVNNLTSEISFLVEALSTEGCGSVASNVAVQPVFEMLAPPTIDLSNPLSPDTACYGSSDFEVIITEEAAPEMSFTYQWFVNGSPVDAEDGGTTVPFNTTLTEEIEIYVKATSVNGCGQATSSSLIQPVFPDLVSPQISPSGGINPDTLCFGTNGFTLVESSPAASDMAFSYTWFVDGTELVGENMPFLVLPSLEATTTIQLEVNSLNGCGTYVSNFVEVPVFPMLQAPVIDVINNEDAFCYGFSGPTFETTQPVSGANESFDSFWQFSPNGMTWSNLSSESTYTPNPVTQSGHYRLTSTSSIGCGTVASDTVFVSVLPAITPSVIEGAQTLCFMEAGIDLIGNITTGADGHFTYQWMSSSGGEATPIIDNDGLTLVINGLPETTTFTLQATSTYGCGVVESNPVEVFVWDELIPGSLLEVADTACFGWDVAIEATPVISGQNISTQWHIGNSAAVLDEEPEQALELNWNLESLESSKHFAISYTSGNGCGTVWSDTASVTVLPAIVQPEIILEVGGADSICNNSLPPEFLQSAEATGANNAFSYLWQIQLAGSSSWTSINSATEDLLELPAQTQGFTVRQMASDVLCGPAYSNELDVHVFDPFIPATLEGEQLICFGTAPAALSAVGPTGGGNDYHYEWYTMNAADTILIAGENNASIEMAELVETTIYLLQSTSNYGCGSGWSNPLAIEVADSLVAGSFVVNPLGELCSDDEVSAFGTNASGGIGPHEWNWWLGEGDSWQVVGSDLNLAPILLTDTAELTLVFSNSCGVVSSDTTTVIVNPLPPLSSIEGDLNPCVSSVANYLSISDYDPAIDYTWSTNSSSVEITSGESGPAILFDHDASNDPLQFQVTLEYIATGCISDSTFTIIPSSNEAPPMGFVEQKPGLDVLVCSDSTDCAQYQWGILNPETDVIFWLPGENQQFLYYEGLENEPGIFCVEVVYDCGDGVVSCPTLMYWDYTPFLNLDNVETQELIVYPNPFTDALHFSGTTAQAWYLFDQFGHLMSTSQQPATSLIPAANLEQGAYLLVIRTDLGYRRTIVFHQ